MADDANVWWGSRTRWKHKKDQENGIKKIAKINRKLANKKQK